MKVTINEIIQSLSKADAESLYSIYQHRCLNRQQLKKLHFDTMYPNNEVLSNRNAKKNIKTLLKFELIKEISFRPDESVFFLTTTGIEVLRQIYSFPANIYDEQKKTSVRGYFRASELEILPRNINHQVHLNNFVIDFMSNKGDIPIKYADEKFMNTYTRIRPDGLFSFGDVDVFLEMDMATEKKSQLYEKWEQYRNFINSNEYFYRERKIVVLFIVAGTHLLENRIDLVRYTIYETLLDLHDGDFEIVVGTHETLKDYLLKHLVPSFKNNIEYKQDIIKTLKDKHQYVWSEAIKLNKIFKNAKFDGYVRKLNEENKIYIENNRIQEFLVDDYYFSPTDIIAKIAYIQNYNLTFRERYNRNFSYLIICESERSILKDLKSLDLTAQPNVFYTTLERLKSLPFHEAIFQFDQFGNLFHFENNGLTKQVFEAALGNLDNF
ncbi:hypothetical protein ABD91_25770 [Lysinibacillus sphaericus]|uniref:replication-relaxation family protein n=1 Tax=Lysinibacillus sphaericus TaxID=1421 RepID=UPI0018CEF585|nr:replication-relaxation family protein [Lysinibacillus sphaericus]MBG9694147.1 hypothetical protein [Lysinibacillus sphaericus]